jgi:hypothetical protein
VRPRPLVAVVALVLATLALLVAPAAAGATPRPATGGAPWTRVVQQPDAPADDGTGGSAESDDAEDEVEEPVPADDIIPEPNSGREPTEAGERGGALQALVLVAIVAGVGGVVAMIVRESRRNRAARPTP